MSSAMVTRFTRCESGATFAFTRTTTVKVIDSPAGIVPANEVENLFENIPGTGLRLNAEGGAQVIAAEKRQRIDSLATR